MAVKTNKIYIGLFTVILLLGGMLIPPGGLGAEDPPQGTMVPLPPSDPSTQPPPKHPDVQAAENRYNSLTWSDVNAKNRQDDPSLYYFYNAPTGSSGQAAYVMQPSSQNTPSAVIVSQQEKQ
jgi:hypothetical protein